MPTLHGVGSYRPDEARRHIEGLKGSHPELDDAVKHLREVHGMRLHDIKSISGWELNWKSVESTHRLDHRWAYGEKSAKEKEPA